MNPNSIKTENVSHLWYQRVLIQTHSMYTASYRWEMRLWSTLNWLDCNTQSQMQTYRVSSVDLSSIIKSVLDINIISACLRYFVTDRENRFDSLHVNQIIILAAQSMFTTKNYSISLSYLSSSVNTIAAPSFSEISFVRFLFLSVFATTK